MNEVKHTPGPWRVERDGHNHYGMIEVVGPALRVTGFTIATDVTQKRANQIVANAHLIAAAPDLLEALKEIVEYVAKTCDDNGNAGPEICQLDNFGPARAAIAKAEGKS